MKFFLKIFILFFILMPIFGLLFFNNVIYIKAAVGDSCYSSTDCNEPDGETCQGGNEETDVEGRCVGGGGAGDMCTDDSDCASGTECISGTCVNPNAGGGQSGQGTSSDYGLSSVPSSLRNIGNGDILTVIVNIVKYVLGFVGIILFIMLFYGGIMYMTSAGNEEQIGKAKKVLTYAIIGIVIVAFSFLIAQFIINALIGSGGSNSPSGGGSSGS